MYSLLKRGEKLYELIEFKVSLSLESIVHRCRTVSPSPQRAVLFKSFTGSARKSSVKLDVSETQREDESMLMKLNKVCLLGRKQCPVSQVCD